jgi:hypothetical protein
LYREVGTGGRAKSTIVGKEHFKNYLFTKGLTSSNLGRKYCAVKVIYPCQDCDHQGLTPKDLQYAALRYATHCFDPADIKDSEKL